MSIPLTVLKARLETMRLPALPHTEVQLHAVHITDHIKTNCVLCDNRKVEFVSFPFIVIVEELLLRED